MIHQRAKSGRWALKRRFIEVGVFVRSIRNIVYLTPALTIGEEDLNRLTGAVIPVLEQRARL